MEGGEEDGRRERKKERRKENSGGKELFGNTLCPEYTVLSHTFLFSFHKTLLI